MAREQLPAGGFVLCGIGSLLNPRLRLAGQGEAATFSGPYEVLTLCGTITPEGAHLHASLAAATGEVVGGHVAYGSEVRTTVEALLVELPGWSLARVHDARTGSLELQATRVPGHADAA